MKPHFPPNQGLVALVASFLLMLVGLAGTADAQIQPPVCPSKECSKVITFYNNTPDRDLSGNSGGHSES